MDCTLNFMVVCCLRCLVLVLAWGVSCELKLVEEKNSICDLSTDFNKFLKS